MLCSLSVTDLLYSQFSLYVNVKSVLIEHMCTCLANMGLKYTIMYTLCTGATLGTLAVISRDRYLAVAKPFWCRNNVTKSRAIKMSCIPWLVSVVFEFDSGYTRLVHDAAFLVYYFIRFIIIIFSHFGIYFKKKPIGAIRKIHVEMEREKSGHYRMDPAGIVVNVYARFLVAYCFSSERSKKFWGLSPLLFYPLHCECIRESFVEV